MPLFRSSVAGFGALALEGSLALRIGEQMSFLNGRRAGASEVRSWQRSLPVLANDLVQAGLDQVEVLVEQALPLSSKRVDVMLAGFHPATGRRSYVVIELKQWSTARAYEDDPSLVTVDGYGQRPHLHPVQQVSDYCRYLASFTTSLHDQPDSIVGAAYLHNALDETAIADLRGLPQTPMGRLFTGSRRQEWTDFLQSRLDPEKEGAPAADAFLASGIAPSTQLLAVAADEVQRREQFILLDDQRLAFDLVLHEIAKARRADSKSVVLVTGGPGSGKSVIALSLLGELARRGTTVLHATGSRSFTQTLRKVAGSGSSETKSLFTYFNSFIGAEPNSVEVLLADEAHRIRETSVSRWTKRTVRDQARPQVDELLSIARVPVFLLDEHQVVRPGELGSVDEITAHAAKRGLDVHRVDLDAQFRCGGSQAYVSWVLRLLGLEPGGPLPWSDGPTFSVRAAKDPAELERLLVERQAAGYGVRMTAGYCWPWSDPRSDGSLVPDVSIGDWSRPWNLKGDRAIGGAPPASLWATAEGGFDQVGCVYTAQGFEYDWSGVILGPDLVWRTDRWEIVREQNKDPDFRSRTRVPDAEFAGLVRNVYKVLLTRGMRGTVVTSTDPETQLFLQGLIQVSAASRV